MKREGGLMERVATFENLYRAYRLAARGKKRTHSVAHFTMDLETELLALERALRAGTWRPGPVRTFVTRDSKERCITVAPFRDRVVHHAVMNLAAPVLERRFDFDSYGCRKGKGMDKALARAQRFCRRHAWCLKTDVRAFYASIDHAILEHLLGRVFKDRALLDLFHRILEGGGDRGLPLGSLTSQWCANLYLTPLDRFLRARDEAAAYVRYMDDVLVFGGSKQALKALLRDMEIFLKKRLHLFLNRRVTRIAPAWSGIPFLGFCVLPQGLRVRRETWKRYGRKVARREWEHRRGRITEEALAASVCSMTAHLERAKTLGLRKIFLERRGIAEY